MKKTFKFWKSCADADANKKPVEVKEFEGPSLMNVFNQAANYCDTISFNATFDEV